VLTWLKTNKAIDEALEEEGVRAGRILLRFRPSRTGCADLRGRRRPGPSTPLPLVL